MPLSDEILHDLRSYLVSLVGTYRILGATGRATGEHNSFIFSGFILMVRGSGVFVTAGHATRELDDALESKKIELAGCRMVDHFAPDARSFIPIPFPYADSERVSIVEDGLDFGLIPLSRNCQDLIAANNVIALNPHAWKPRREPDFDYYVLLGLPEAWNQVRMSDDHATMQVKPTIIRVEQTDERPSGIDSTRFPRFVGKLPNRLPLRSIRGMSGGPIFGFFANRRGLHYFPVAIQSSWLPKPKIIIGCPIVPFARAVEAALRPHPRRSASKKST